jgi:hypothetical protein
VQLVQNNFNDVLVHYDELRMWVGNVPDPYGTAKLIMSTGWSDTHVMDLSGVAADAADEPTWFEYMADLRERQATIKALGGRFDKERRRWYVPAGLSLAPFRDYLQPPEPTYLELDLSTRPAHRAELKALGARYDTQRKRWYVPRDVTQFRRWLTIDT